MIALTMMGFSQSVDTTGLSGWKGQYNSYKSWDIGAFNQTKNPSNPVDFGWGKYSMSTHHITADSFYIIKTAGGNFKKFAVEKLASGVWTFKHANIDGSNEVKKSVNRNIVTNKNFFYYSIDQDKTLDLEGDNTKWDIVFTKYLKYFASMKIHYGVAGVLHNRGYKSSMVTYNSGGSSTVADSSSFPFSADINKVGYQWKNAFAGVVYDTIDFYVKSPGNTINKLQFTGYGGSSTGKMVFKVNGAADSIVLGSGNKNQVYYDLDARKVVHTNTNQNWDVAFFAVPGTTKAPIRINDVNGVRLYTYPKGKLSTWSGSSSIENVKRGLEILSVYPNPARNFVNVALYSEMGAEPFELNILDINGRVLRTETLPVNGAGITEHRVDINDLTSGIYLVSLKGNGMNGVKRIIVE